MNQIYRIHLSSDHVNSPQVSIQRWMIDATLDKELSELLVEDESYRGQDLLDLIASAVQNGTRSKGGEKYWLGTRTLRK